MCDLQLVSGIPLKKMVNYLLKASKIVILVVTDLDDFLLPDGLDFNAVEETFGYGTPLPMTARR